MQIVICLNAGEQIESLDVAENCQTIELKIRCESLWGKPHSKMEIFRDGELLGDFQTLRECNISEGDFLCVLTPVEVEDEDDIEATTSYDLALTSSSTHQMATADCSDENSDSSDQTLLRIKDVLQKTIGSVLWQSNCKINAALEKGDLANYFKTLSEQMDHQTNVYKQLRKDNAICLTEDNKQTTVQLSGASNYADGQRNMLKIACKINGISIKAVIDSTAPVSLMSLNTAEHCKIIHLVDTKYEDDSKGLITKYTVMGKVHQVNFQIGDTIRPLRFTVVHRLAQNLLIGLDMLRAHNCLIDFMRNVFIIGLSETQFLNENNEQDEELSDEIHANPNPSL